MHAPNHGCKVRVTLRNRSGTRTGEYEGYLQLSLPRKTGLDTGISMVDALGKFPVYTCDTVELVN